MKKPRLIGHRGAAAKAPENTLASLRRALKEGADGIEFDVRATLDDVAVLLHDETLDRTTAGKGPLRSTPLAKLRALDAGGWFSSDFAGEKVPDLQEVLGEFLGKVPLAMEMKERLPGLALLEVAERLRANREAELVVVSFEKEALQQARDLLPAAPRGLVLRPDTPLPDDSLRMELGLWGVFAPNDSVDERFLVDCRRAGLHCYAYVVNEPERGRELARWGVDGLISDDPGALRETLE